VIGCPEISMNILETILNIEGWKFVTSESKDYLSINFEGKWTRRNGKIVSRNPGSKTATGSATGSASRNPLTTAWRFLTQCPYGPVNNICVLWPSYTPCDRNAINNSR